jgi:hypothetical protein
MSLCGRRRLGSHPHCVDPHGKMMKAAVARSLIGPQWASRGRSSIDGEADHHPRGGGDAYLTHRQFCERYRVSARTAQRWRVTWRWHTLCSPRAADSAAGAILPELTVTVTNACPSGGRPLPRRLRQPASVRVEVHPGGKALFCKETSGARRLRRLSTLLFFFAHLAARASSCEGPSPLATFLSFFKKERSRRSRRARTQSLWERTSELSIRSTRTDARRRESKRLHSIQTSDSVRFSQIPQ